ncbi:RNA polymerase sigma factor, sigma-70 family [Bryocella elongata]|uniref:RNA polymerase sigma factor, sigma-70 family n=1 Tax=Bryocella elongata TaxID=863522 RepID=A0A1H5WWT4_9BACT|nr:sigma-70 family RNA polymerase sigma factor [Bryocella elongata]SEG03944.1 RNA polymerase sigma factor, sigma-70 family [Bryocella elongata]
MASVVAEAQFGMAGSEWTLAEQDHAVAEAVARDEPRLRRFIRSRVMDTGDAEDVLQDVLYELVSTYRLMKPVEQVTAWMYRVARNRITDLFRKQKAVSLDEPAGLEADAPSLAELLPSADAGPEAAYARKVMVEAIEEALAELPRAQREVFVAHEIEGRSFKDLAAETGVNQNTLLARKRYAVLHLRKRLEQMRKDFGIVKEER